VTLAGAGILLLSLALAACGSATAPPSPAATTSAGFAGYKWTVLTIAHNDVVTRIPARYAVYLAFEANGAYGANDPVNFHSGTYRQTANGFRTSVGAVSAVGYIGHDPIVLLTQSAISALDSVSATTALTGDSLQVSVDHGQWILTCRRDGQQPSAASASQAGFVGYKWTVTAISHGRQPISVPARDNVYLAYVLTCQRDGKVNFPAAQSSSPPQPA